MTLPSLVFCQLEAKTVLERTHFPLPCHGLCRGQLTWEKDSNNNWTFTIYTTGLGLTGATTAHLSQTFPEEKKSWGGGG